MDTFPTGYRAGAAARCASGRLPVSYGLVGERWSEGTTCFGVLAEE
jgi:hypothetical protein